MISVLYSIAGKKSQKVYNYLVALDRSYLTGFEKALLNEMLEAYDKTGEFLSLDYLKKNYGEYTPSCRAYSDLVVTVEKILSERKKLALSKKVTDALFEAGSDKDLRKRLLSISTDLSSSDDSLVVPDPLVLYKSLPEGEGYITGITDVDELTNGFMRGTAATIVAYTSHGKTMEAINSIYLNLVRGFNIVYVSLELPIEFIYFMLLSRASYALGGLMIPSKKIMERRLTKSEEEYMVDVLVPHLKGLPGKFIALDLGDFGKFEVADIKNVYARAQSVLGGLDAILFDHVNILKKIYGTEFTDKVIQTCAYFGKDYVNNAGQKLVTIYLAQANRQGFMRAKRRQGEYDLAALAELNELERSSTYVLSLYSDEVMMSVNEMKVFLLKHRLGARMVAPSRTSVYPAMSVIGDGIKEISSDMDLSKMIDDLDFDM